jgi:hypothetical protein
VRLSVSDLFGREVSVLVNERREAGVHELKFDARLPGLPAVYGWKGQAGGQAGLELCERGVLLPSTSW